VTIGLDTSVVVRLLIGEPLDQTEKARRLLLTRPKGAPALVSDLVIGESYFTLRHHYHVSHDAAIQALRRLADDPAIQVSVAALHALEQTADATEGPGFMDRLIHAAYRIDGADFVTFDAAAARLEGARQLD
jgi:predicted nucleic acid-binding protein